MTHHTLIFCHLPKASGTSLRSILFREYPRHAILTLDGRVAENTVRFYRHLEKKEKCRYIVIEGHYPVGLHRYVPGRSTYITLLREPVDRVISYYFHVLRDPEHYAYKRGFKRHMDIRELVEGSFVYPEVQNGQTWFLSGGVDPLLDPSLALEQAKFNIQHLFSVVGLTERFDESVLLMRRRLGWKKWPVYCRHHVAPRRLRVQEIDEQTLSIIREHNQLDLQLYEYAKARFEEQIAHEGTDFQRELAFFRVLNYGYQRFVRARMMASRIKHGLLG